MARHQRPQSFTRLDIVAIMLHGKKPLPSATRIKTPELVSPCDSLDPLDESRRRRIKESTPSRREHEMRFARRPVSMNHMQKDKKEPQLAIRHGNQRQRPARASLSPRSPRAAKRPPPLTLRSSNGHTATNSPDLKRRICDSSPDQSPTILQVPIDTRKPLPPTPTTPFTVMGNKPSSLSGSPPPDDRSVVHHELRRPAFRKSSSNFFKRVDSKSPLPRDLTASVMSMLHRDGHEKSASCTTDDDGLVSVPTDPYFDPSDQYDDGRYPRPCPKVHSASTITTTEEKAGLPLSASTTIREYRSNNQSPVQITTGDNACDIPSVPTVSSYEDIALSPASPTIPAPSPLPEDSPHKYGLRDKIDTPEVPEQPDKIEVAKMRRKSSGLEIFNDAKSLQSAQSFLNGLSTSRRRAESATDIHPLDVSDSTWTTTSAATSRPQSTRPSSIKGQATYRDIEGRRKGHSFKSSGFAFSRPLIVSQIKCYRSHERLVPSRNKHAPVECAVCHIDDDADHFSCSWCALRMCRYCRKDFTERGMNALRERIRKAELGGADDSANSSFENLQALKKSKSTSFA